MSAHQPALAEAMPRPVIVYCSDTHTYACEDGDAQPTYADLPPLCHETMHGLLKPHEETAAHGTRAAAVRTTAKVPIATAAATVTGTRSIASLAASLHELLAGRDVVLVASAASYADWPTLLKCVFVVGGASSVYVVSDVVATTLACGGTEEDSPRVVVVHASWSDVTLSMVTDGFSRRYVTASEGSLHDTVQRSSSAKRMNHMAEHDNAPAAAATLDSSSSVLSIRDLAKSNELSSAAYRSQLIRAFGFHNYMRVLCAYEMRAQRETLRQRAAAAGGSKGKGKGRGARPASYHAPRDGPDGSRGEWVAKLSHAEKHEPGVLEHRFARVLKTPPAANTLYPVLITGEALQVPFYRDLLRCAVLHCGPSVLRAVAREQREKARVRDAKRQAQHQLEQQHRKTALAVAAAKAPAPKARPPVTRRNADAKSAARRKRRREDSDDSSSGAEEEEGDTSEEEEEEQEEEAAVTDSDDEDQDGSRSTHTSSSPSDRSESSESDDEDDADEYDETAEEGEWVVLQRTILDPPPPWLPLLGGSVLARILPSFDTSKMRIVREELEASQDQVVYWKAVL